MNAERCYRWLDCARRLELCRRTVTISILVGFLDLAAVAFFLCYEQLPYAFSLCLFLLFGTACLMTVCGKASRYLRIECEMMEIGGVPAGDDEAAVRQSIRPGIRNPVVSVLLTMLLFFPMMLFLHANGLIPCWLLMPSAQFIGTVSIVSVAVGIFAVASVGMKETENDLKSGLSPLSDKLWRYCLTKQEGGRNGCEKDGD